MQATKSYAPIQGQYRIQTFSTSFLKETTLHNTYDSVLLKLDELYFHLFKKVSLIPFPRVLTLTSTKTSTKAASSPQDIF